MALLNQPDGNGAKASIREVYQIVSSLETKFIDALNEAERRLHEGQTGLESRVISSIEDRDRKWTSDIVRLEEDIERLDGAIKDLKAWRVEADRAHAARDAATSARKSVFTTPADFIEKHWRLLAVILAILAFILDLRIDGFIK